MTWSSSRLHFSISSNCGGFRILVLHRNSFDFRVERVELKSHRQHCFERPEIPWVQGTQKLVVSGKCSCFNHGSPTSKMFEGETHVDLLSCWRPRNVTSQLVIYANTSSDIDKTLEMDSNRCGVKYLWIRRNVIIRNHIKTCIMYRISRCWPVDHT